MISADNTLHGMQTLLSLVPLLSAKRAGRIRFLPSLRENRPLCWERIYVKHNCTAMLQPDPKKSFFGASLFFGTLIVPSKWGPCVEMGTLCRNVKKYATTRR